MPQTTKTAAALDTLTIDDLESARNLSRNTRDRERWTALEWLKLYAAYKACHWDKTPDEWTAAQVKAAITKGIAPTWED